MALQPQTLTAVKIPDLGDPGEPVGVIGSDVWNRFGELRVDFRRRDLVVPGSERAAPNRTIPITKPAISRLPKSLISGAALRPGWAGLGWAGLKVRNYDFPMV